MSSRPGLLDTSVLIAAEDHPLDGDRLPAQTAVCVVTLAELQAGVLAAPDTATRSRRLATLEAASATDPLTVTPEVARHWATLRAGLAERGLRADDSDLWTAAVALAHDLDVVTRGEGFAAIEDVGGPRVVRV